MAARDDSLTTHLLHIRTAALRAVDPYQAVMRFMAFDGPSTGELKAASLRIGDNTWSFSGTNRVLLVAAGKAAPEMARAAAEILGPYLSEGVVVTKYGHSSEHNLPGNLKIIEAGHPIPDANGLSGARLVERLLRSATASGRVLVLLSGGASALLPLPVAGVSLDDLQTVTSMLLRSGADIRELNTVRKHLDRLKGGQMARLAYPAQLAALVLSDVVGDPLEVIASGPTVPDPSTYADAIRILEHYNLVQAAPSSIVAHLRAGLESKIPETPKPGDPLFDNVMHVVVGSNRQAALAAVDEAASLGYNTLLLTTFLEGEASQVGRFAAALARGIHQQGDPVAAPACLVLGGETTVTVRGSGKGGRNQELALSASLDMEGLPGVALMALATDGTDGPTDAAGAIVDEETATNARSLGLDLQAALENNDSYPALEAAGALMKIGPTGTNVNDLLVILVR